MWGDRYMDGRRRKDQWTEEDDARLAEIVIQAVKSRGTQLEAFEQAAAELNRTKQACGFRWNKTLRGQYNQTLHTIRNKPQQSMRSHLKLALTSFDELTEAYTLLEKKHRDLQLEHEKLVKWLQQGFSYLPPSE